MNLALFDFDGTLTTREMFPDTHEDDEMLAMADHRYFRWPQSDQASA